MNALIKNFLASRSETPRRPIANAQQVTREDFAVLTQAVALLVEEVETLTSPGKLGAVINQAFEEANKKTPISNNRNRGYLIPKSDDIAGKELATNARQDRSFLIPSGE